MIRTLVKITAYFWAAGLTLGGLLTLVGHLAP